MLLSEMAQKELIQVEEGIRYGFLADTDLIFNRKTGEIIGFEVKKKFGRFPFRNREQETSEFIPWSEIVLIGEHRILFGKTHSMGDFDLDEY
ncbi:hypothetical protein SLU01_02890 [Sporosarcina luteola]|uniref:PRC-barrel domain-containing protein n=1 Tax=Sporosarcina luteola TaxID=582850 RepID=A0A511Z3I5_9BACL|nr:YlmC/YmxH family sporulation protein [Sporosarcina luteola]GEN81977.1 hypothetical protein SLU01_02890 [Sporosarcina luteola]